MKKVISVILILTIVTISGVLIAYSILDQETISYDRYSQIPIEAIKSSPSTDNHPPILHSSEFETPIPLLGLVNSAGGEDSPFISPDGNMLYFFFTPDVNIQPEQQLNDNVTGIYFSEKTGEVWGEPKRIVLQEQGKLALDGCEFIDGNQIYFCSAREGYTGLNWFMAKSIDNQWKDWTLVDFDPSFEIGELHISRDKQELLFHSSRPGGVGGLDIWKSKRIKGEWDEPLNFAELNSSDDEGWPYINEEMDQIWFTRTYLGTPAIYRSIKQDLKWSDPELIISQFAGEPSLDREGNLYFTHAYYIEDEMVESDIYVAYPK